MVATSSTDDKFPDRTVDFSNARQEGGKAIEIATDAAAGMLSSAKASAGDFADNAAETFKSAVEDQKTAGAGAIGDVARAAKGAADNFQDRAPELANAVRTMAGRVEGISNDIRDRSVNELMASVTEFAGQKPMAFFGCGILAGLVISRLLSSSNR
jgi:ABC-type transporter Mla subunit MlaD